MISSFRKVEYRPDPSAFRAGLKALSAFIVSFMFTVMTDDKGKT